MQISQLPFKNYLTQIVGSNKVEDLNSVLDSKVEIFIISILQLRTPRKDNKFVFRHVSSKEKLHRKKIKEKLSILWCMKKLTVSKCSFKLWMWSDPVLRPQGASLCFSLLQDASLESLINCLRKLKHSVYQTMSAKQTLCWI